MNRRQFIKGFASAGVIGSVAGCISPDGLVYLLSTQNELSNTLKLTWGDLNDAPKNITANVKPTERLRIGEFLLTNIDSNPNRRCLRSTNNC